MLARNSPIVFGFTVAANLFTTHHPGHVQVGDGVVGVSHLAHKQDGLVFADGVSIYVRCDDYVWRSIELGDAGLLASGKERYRQ